MNRLRKLISSRHNSADEISKQNNKTGKAKSSLETVNIDLEVDFTVSQTGEEDSMEKKFHIPGY